MPRKLKKNQIVFLWVHVRKYIGETLCAFIANFAIQLQNRQRGYGHFVGAIVAACAVYSSIFICFPVSGAQINPMVSVAVVLTRRMSALYLPFYWSAQILGSWIAVALGKELSPYIGDNPYAGMTLPGKGVTDLQAIVMEIIITYVLLAGILALLDELRVHSFNPTNRFNCFILLVSIFFFMDTLAAPISGACTNPARSLGADLLNLSFYRQYIYLLGPFLGMLIAVIIQEFVFSPDASLARAAALFNFKEQFDRDRWYSHNNNQLIISIENKQMEELKLVDDKPDIQLFLTTPPEEEMTSMHNISSDNALPNQISGDLSPRTHNI